MFSHECSTTGTGSTFLCTGMYCIHGREITAASSSQAQQFERRKTLGQGHSNLSQCLGFFAVVVTPHSILPTKKRRVPDKIFDIPSKKKKKAGKNAATKVSVGVAVCCVAVVEEC